MDQDLELLQSRMTLLVAKCVDALHTRIIDLQEQMAFLQQEYHTLQAQVNQAPAHATASDSSESLGSSKISPEQKRQIQESLKILGAISGWGLAAHPGEGGVARLGAPGADVGHGGDTAFRRNTTVHQRV